MHPPLSFVILQMREHAGFLSCHGIAHPIQPPASAAVLGRLPCPRIMCEIKTPILQLLPLGDPRAPAPLTARRPVVWCSRCTLLKTRRQDRDLCTCFLLLMHAVCLFLQDSIIQLPALREQVVQQPFYLPRLHPVPLLHYIWFLLPCSSLGQSDFSSRIGPGVPSANYLSRSPAARTLGPPFWPCQLFNLVPLTPDMSRVSLSQPNAHAYGSPFLPRLTPLPLP